MGGDRDGNPFVTSKVTEEVLLLSRWEAAKLYEKALTKLIRSFSMQKCSKKILKYTGHSYEPYRVYLRPLRDKMRRTHRMIERHLVQKKPLNQKELISSKEDILKPLRVVRESLEQSQNENKLAQENQFETGEGYVPRSTVAKADLDFDTISLVAEDNKSLYAHCLEFINNLNNKISNDIIFLLGTIE